ncbi:hypothetical protein HYY75_01260, partial [bacterium]|nr:hypothetical protein [bacterium]
MNEEISGNHGFFSKFSFERLTIWILYLIPFWSLPGILFWSGFQSYLTFRQRSEVREIFNAMHQKIGQISAEFEPTVFLTKFLNQTMGEKSLVCQNVDDWGKALNSTLNSLGTGCAEIMIFDSSNNLIFPKSNSSFDRLCEAFELIRNPPWKTGWKEINYSPVISSGDKIFPQDVHQLAKGGKKARLLRLSQRCTWGYWGTLPGVIARKNLAVLIIIHKEHLSDSACAQFVLKANSSPRFQMGAYNLSLNQALYVPQSVSPSRFQYFSHRLRQTRETDVQEENLLLTSNVTARNTMLIALSQIPIPPGSFFLASFLMFFLLSFPILVFSFRIVVLRAKPKWSIRDKFIGVLCISTGIPAMGILMISSFYISEHEKRLVDFAYQDLESTLDGIENNFPQELENVRADFEKKLNPFMTWPQKGTALSDLLESLENENFCEHAHLVSSSGVTLKRQFLGNSNLIREAIHLPREVRVKKAYSWFCNESILSRIDCAILDLESQSSGPVSLDRYQKLVHGGWGDMISTASQRILFDAIRQFGKDISSAYNLAHGFSGGIEANQMQGLILSSLVEWEAGDLIRNISSNLKRLVLLESNKESCHNYIDIVQDAEGRAQWVLILYNNSLYLEAKYLRKIFASGRLIPKETSFWAISDHSLAEEYDDPSSPGEFSNYFFRLSQTKSRIRDRVLRPQGEQLVSAFRSRNLPHYILIATTPVSRISEAISWERRKINWIIGFLGAFSLFMAFLTAKSYLGPVHHL